MRKLNVVLILFSLVVFGVFGFQEVRKRLDYDNVSPVISDSVGELQLSVNADESEYLNGLTAMDNKDGDVTKSIVVESKSKFSKKGELKVTYAAFDSSNNVGKYERKVVYTDYVSPHFSADAPFRFASGSASINPTEHIHATDVLDGDISNNVRLLTADDGNTMAYGYAGMDENTDVNVTLEVTNASGDTADLGVVMHLLDNQSYNASVPLLSQYIVYTKVGAPIDPASYITGTWSAGNGYPFDENSVHNAGDVSISSGVDYNTPGTYTITFTLNPTSEGENTGSTDMYVVVEE